MSHKSLLNCASRKSMCVLIKGSLYYHKYSQDAFEMKNNIAIYYGFGIVVNRYINNFSNVIDKNLGRAREHLLIKCCINLLSLLFLDHSLMIYKIDDHHIR